MALLLITTDIAAQSATVNFRKHVIHGDFISEGVAVADVNNDGLTDILAGAYWFQAPDWQVHQLTNSVTYDHTSEWSDSFLNFASDVDQDGWTDLIVFDFPGTEVNWFKNPGKTGAFWKKFLIDSTARNESPMMIDLDGDDHTDLVFGTGNDQMTWFEGEPTGSQGIIWKKVAISTEKAPGSSTFSHGLGYDDMDGDGRKDIITTGGWWQAPVAAATDPWTLNETGLGQPCSQMYLFDLDHDGDQDLLSASAHNYGIWWHEQLESSNGGVFKEHLIDSSFSQTHGLALIDLNGDGLPDFITGKRYFAHNGKDPGGHEPAVLYWYEMRRDRQQRPSWVPHLIDNNSGVGLQVVVEDITGDQKSDIVIANKKGVFLFESY